ncbi:MAG: cation:proton antiporter [Clostridiaceae bacterium]|jgi:Kef-type K+ transport system membrane component KefB|nr:cation:proton antiporter [Clostridiaceae bacterium]
MKFTVLFYLALILLSGLIFGRAVKLIKLPNVTGYLLAGIILGPYCLKLLSPDLVSELELISEMALAFIAFSIGSEFKLSYLKKVGNMVIIIATAAALLATVLVTVSLVIIGVEFEIALLLGAIASATAPAATVMVIKQYNARGPVTESLLSVVAIDDAIAIILFGFSMAIVNSMQYPGETPAAMSIVMPVIEIVGSLLIGALLGFLFTFPLKYFKKDSNRLIITTGFVFFASAIASVMNLSPLLLCMSMGAVLVNISNSARAIFTLADGVTPPIYLMFFVVSGAGLNISILPEVGLIGVVYIVTRFVGKVFGSYYGSVITKAPDTVKKYLGLTLIPQAGVAIGLSLIASRGLPMYAQPIRAVVLSATFVYELIGPILTKVSLKKAGEISG